MVFITCTFNENDAADPRPLGIVRAALALEPEMAALTIGIDYDEKAVHRERPVNNCSGFCGGINRCLVPPMPMALTAGKADKYRVLCGAG